MKQGGDSGRVKSTGYGASESERKGTIKGAVAIEVRCMFGNKAEGVDGVKYTAASLLELIIENNHFLDQQSREPLSMPRHRTVSYFKFPSGQLRCNRCLGMQSSINAQY